jgi:hypothetical protein
LQATGRKTAFPAPNKKLQHNPKQPLDRKSPIQVCEPSVPLGFRDRDILELIGKVAVTPCHRMVNAVA